MCVCIFFVDLLYAGNILQGRTIIKVTQTGKKLFLKKY